MFNALSEEQEYEKRAFYSRLLTKSERDRIRNINVADKQAIRNIIDNYDFGEDDFYAQVGGDFYGENIDGVYLLKDTQDSIQRDIETYLFAFSKV